MISTYELIGMTGFIIYFFCWLRIAALTECSDASAGIRSVQKVARIHGTLLLRRPGRNSAVLTSLNLEFDYFENKKGHA